jgi:FKBP-type peptidyl-prolyl cis-trans isomerase
MMKYVLAVALLALGACGKTDTSRNDQVMQEIAKSEKQEAAQVEPEQTLPSGLHLQFQHRGPNQTLARPTVNAVVRVHYEGRLVSNNNVFDSSFARNEPADFPLNAVVPGFAEAIEQMRPGDEVIATFPGELGYGARGMPPEIPPNSALRFRIRLIAFQEPNGPVVGQP